MKLKFVLKKDMKRIKPYLELPHTWALLMVTVLATIMCLLSVYYKDTQSFTSSICSNVFAGLLTGVIICLISTIKSVSLYRTECLIEWLEDLHNDCLIFNKMYRKIIFARDGDFKDDDEFNDYIYDTLCYGNEISQKINQGRYDQSLPFNTYKYCKKVFHFNATKIKESNDLLRDRIIESHFSVSSKANVKKLFDQMYDQIYNLDRRILSKSKELNIKKKALNISIG